MDSTVEARVQNTWLWWVWLYKDISIRGEAFQSPVLISLKMYIKLSLLVVLFSGLLYLSNAQTTDCSNNCMRRARCTPYHKDLVWAVVDRVCRVFQNGCIFGNENCMRANQCQPRKLFLPIIWSKLKIIYPPAMVATTKENCMKSCPRMCSRGAPEVCGWFPFTDNNGVTGGRYRTFRSRCLLDLYACRNAEGENKYYIYFYITLHFLFQLMLMSHKLDAALLKIS